jgi:hypothetical protein
MISSSSSTVLPFVGSILTGDFTSLDKPTDVSGVATIGVFLPMDPILSDLKGELSPETRCES